MAMLVFLLLCVVVLGGVAVWGVGTYNGLVRARNAYRNAFAQIDVQLQRRFDLIPNLVETVKGYMAHERQTLEAVIAARSSAQQGLAAAKANPGDAAAMASLAAGQEQLNGALGRLLAVSEAYPDLKANQNMAQLSEELTSTENRVGFARQAFNDAVTDYNTRCEVFPGSLIAGPFHFEQASLLDIPLENRAQVRAAPSVTF